jgi:hypothetical protein
MLGMGRGITNITTKNILLALKNLFYKKQIDTA